MATQYTSILKLALPVTGELSGTWGDVVNNNITSMVEQAIAGLSTINTWTANAHTLTVADGTTSESRCAMLVAATGAGGTALTAAGEIICPAASKLYVLKNGAAYAVTLKTAAGTGVAVPVGDTAFLFCDGTNVNACVTTIVNGHISGNLTVDGNTTLGDANTDTVTVTAQFASDLLPSTDNARDLGSTAKSWRTLYCDTSVLVGNLSLAGNTLSSTDTNGNIVIAPNGTGDVQLDADTVRVGDSNANATITTNGTGDLILNTNAGTNSGSITIQDGVDGNIIIAPNGTGQVQISNAALDLTTIEVTNIKAKDGTASATIADSTGVMTIASSVLTTTDINGGTIDGAVIGGSSAAAGTFTTATATTGNITTVNATTVDTTNIEVTNIKAKDGTAAMSIADSTGAITASTLLNVDNLRLDGNTLSSTDTNGNITIAPNGTGQVVMSGDLDITTIEVTNIKAKDGTAAASIANSTGVVSVSANPVLSAGTANGVAFLDGSKVLTTGSALTFDGSVFAVGRSTPTSAIVSKWDNTSDSNRGAAMYLSGAAGSGLALLASTSSGYPLAFGVDGTERARITLTGGFETKPVANGHAIFNEDGVDADFRVESDADTHCLFVDASANNVGIGTNAPASKLHVDAGSLAPTSGHIARFDTSATTAYSSGGFVGGQLRLNYGNATSSYGGINFANFGVTSQEFFGVVQNSSGYGNFVWQGYNGSYGERMRLDSSGNLGVGTNAPLGKVHSFSSSSGASPSSNGNQLVLESSGNAGLTIATGASSLGNIFFADSGDNADGYIQYDQSGRSLRFGTATAEKMRLDSSGNLGLGVTPSAWRTDFSTRAIQVGLVGSLSSLQASTTNNQTFVSSNTFLGASDWVYLYSDAASQYRQYAGQHNWFTAPSGTANTTTITNGVSYTIITSGNQTAFGAANNNVGTQFTATSSGTLSSGTVSQNISFTQAMTLDASGNLGIGTTSPAAKLQVAGGNIRLDSNQGIEWGGSTNFIYGNNSTNILVFATNSAERARITSGGYFKASNDGTYFNSTGTYHELRQTANAQVVTVSATNASFTSESIFSTATKTAGTDWMHFYGTSDGNTVANIRIFGNGNVQNANNSYAGISDQKLKQDIVDAGSQWDDIKSLRIRKYRFKYAPTQPLQLGLVAQEVEQTSPGLVEETFDKDENGQTSDMTTKSVKYSVVYMKAVKALQEAMARIEKLEAEVAALKGA